MLEDDEQVELLAADPQATGVRMMTGLVTDATVFPPLIDTGGGAVATPVLGGYRPSTGDLVQVLTDWNGSFSAARICLSKIPGSATCIATRSSTSAGVGSTTITWDGETVDQGGFITTPSTTFTIIDTGTYALSCRVEGATNFGNGSGLVITAAGLQWPFERNRAATVGVLAATTTVTLNAADTVTATVFNNGAGPVTFTARFEIAQVA